MYPQSLTSFFVDNSSISLRPMSFTLHSIANVIASVNSYLLLATHLRSSAEKRLAVPSTLFAGGQDLPLIAFHCNLFALL